MTEEQRKLWAAQAVEYHLGRAEEYRHCAACAGSPEEALRFEELAQKNEREAEFYAKLA